MLTVFRKVMVGPVKIRKNRILASICLLPLFILSSIFIGIIVGFFYFIGSFSEFATTRKIDV